MELIRLKRDGTPDMRGKIGKPPRNHPWRACVGDIEKSIANGFQV